MSGPKSPPNADLNVRLRLPKSAGAGLALAAAIWSLVPSLSLAQGQTPRQNLGEATVPTQIGVEKATNPFLRPRALAEAMGLGGQSDVAVFAALRAAKDGFKA